MTKCAHPTVLFREPLQGYELTDIPNDVNSSVRPPVPLKACVMVSPENWWQRNLPWIVAIIVVACLLLLAWLTYTMCFRKSRPAVVQVGRCGEVWGV